MRIESTKQMVSSGLKHLPSFELIKNKTIELANKISNFINKTKLFFGATVLFTAFTAINTVSIGPVLASGIFAACVLQSATIFLGFKGLADQDSQNKLDVVMGIMNLCAWYLDPSFGAATSIFNFGIQTSSLVFSKIFEIKNNSA